MEDWAEIVQKPCAGSPDQLFTMKSAGSGARLVAKHSGKCVDLAGPQASVKLLQVSCGDPNAKPGQVWMQRASRLD